MNPGHIRLRSNIINWRRDGVVITIAQRHLKKSEPDYPQVQTLLGACRRFAMERISEKVPGGNKA